jgi:hypothetical protein
MGVDAGVGDRVHVHAASVPHGPGGRCAEASRTRQESGCGRSHRVNTASERSIPRFTSRRSTDPPSSRSPLVADVLFVLLTVALFAALAVLIRAVERW